MPRRFHIPQLGKHKASGLAVARFDGKDEYFGKFGTPEAEAAYKARVAEWLLARGRPAELPAVTPDGLRVKHLLAAYLPWAQLHYRKDGEPVAGQLAVIKSAFRVLARLHGETLVRDFGRRQLLEVRDDMIRGTCASCKGTGSRTRPAPGTRGKRAPVGPDGRRKTVAVPCRRCGGKGARPWTRGYVNKCVAVIRQVWHWASEREMVPDDFWHRLKVLRHLTIESEGVRPDPEPVRPVAEDVVERTCARLNPTVADMVRVQRLALMRPCEVRGMRAEDIDRTGRLPDGGPVLGGLWVYKVPRKFNKLAKLGIVRVVLLGPKAQALLAPYLLRTPAGYLFSPSDAAERWLRANGRAPAREHGRAPGEFYPRRSYNRAVERAARRAGVPHWAPNALRHSGVTEVRELDSLQTAGDLAGHASLETTKRYAAMKLERAAEVARRIG